MRSAVASLALSLVACGQADSAPSGRRGAPVAAEDTRPPVAKLAAAEGDVRWQGAAEAAWTRARLGLPLHPRDAVQTMEGAGATVHFRGAGGRGDGRSASWDGPVARLGPLTTMRIPDQAPEAARLRHLSGRLVARLPEGGLQRLEVELPPGTLVLEPSAAGSSSSERTVEARVEVQEGSTHIAMVEGSARLERTRGGRVPLRANQFVEVRADGEVTQSGRTGARAEPSSPADGSTVRTRRETRFAWAQIPGAQAARLTIRGQAGESRSVDVQAGRTEASVELASGAYSWTVAGRLDGESMPASAPRTLTVDLDQSAPALSLESPAPGATVSGGAVRVAGRTEPGAKLSVQGSEVSVGPDGTFSTTFPVPRGLTNLVVATADDLGNSRVVSRAVLRE